MKKILWLLLVSSAFAQHQVSLSWNPVTPPAGKTITAYNVYRATTSGSVSPNLLTPLGVVGTAYLDTTVIDGTTYYYKIKSWCPACTTPESPSFSSEAQAIIPITPTAPDAPSTITIIIQAKP